MQRLLYLAAGMILSSSALADFKLDSNSFAPFSVLEAKHICLEQNGANTSPQLSWIDVPDAAKSLLLFVHDPDAPHVRGVGHWVVYIDNPQLKSLREGISEEDGVVFGLNERNENAYIGSCPPVGSGVHRYNFTLYALNTQLDKGTVRRLHQNELINLYSDKIIAQAVRTAFYKNKLEQ